MTITEVSETYGLTADTLRYYERIGLLPSIKRTSGGIRNYSEEDCKWIDFIKCMRGAGLSIEVLVEYITLFHQGDHTITARKELLIEQRKELEKRIEQMNETRAYLDKKIEHYEDCLLKKERKLKKFDKQKH